MLKKEQIQSLRFEFLREILLTYYVVAAPGSYKGLEKNLFDELRKKHKEFKQRINEYNQQIRNVGETDLQESYMRELRNVEFNFELLGSIIADEIPITNSLTIEETVALITLENRLESRLDVFDTSLKQYEAMKKRDL